VKIKARGPPYSSKRRRIIASISAYPQKVKIQKQWDALGPRIRNLVRPVVLLEVEKYLNIYAKEVKEFVATSDFDIIMDETYIGMEFEDPITIIMDVYLFLRMLRSDLTDSHIVVVYAGASHTKRYSNLLKDTKLGKVIWSRPMKLDVKCIEIPEKVSKQVEKMV